MMSTPHLLTLPVGESAQCAQIYYRGPQRGSKVHSFRFVADFALPAMDVVALAREWDLVHTWCWPAADSAILQERGNFTFDVYLVLQLPWPFPDRKTVICVQGGDCFEGDGTACVLMESPQWDEVWRCISCPLLWLRLGVCPGMGVQGAVVVALPAPHVHVTLAPASHLSCVQAL